MWRHGWQTTLTIAGLVFGLVCLTFSLNWLWNETHYDFFRKGYRDLYVVQGACYTKEGLESGVPEDWSFYLSYPFCREIIRHLPEDTRYALIGHAGNGRLKDENGNILVYDAEVRCVTPDFAELGDLRTVAGDVRASLSSPDRIVITASLARRLFGDEQKSLGRVLNMDNVDETYTVGAVLEDVPSEISNISYDGLVGDPEKFLTEVDIRWDVYWGEMVVRTSHPEELYETIRGIHRPGEETTCRLFTRPDLVPLRLFHLIGGTSPSELWNRLLYPLAFTLISFLLLCSVFFNYVSLQTSMYMSRVREYVLRRTLGGGFRQQISWLLSDTAVLCGIVFLLAFVALELVTHFAGMPEASVGAERMLLYCMGGFLLMVVMGMAYPMFRLRRLHRYLQQGGRASRTVSRVFLTVQCMVCALLLFVQLTVIRQMRLMFTADLGFKTENILRIPMLQSPMYYEVLQNNFFTFAERLDGQTAPCIELATAMPIDLFEAVGSTSSPPYSIGIPDEEYRHIRLHEIKLPYSAFEMFRLRLGGGEWFGSSDEALSDVIFLNREAIDQLELHDFAAKELPKRIKGVLDFRTGSWQKTEPPTVFYICRDEDMPQEHMYSGKMAVYVKHLPGQEAGAREEILRIAREMDIPEEAVSIERMSDRVLSFYEKERNYLKVFTLMTACSLLVTLFGVLSMVLYALRLHRRTIAVQRVFGATTDMVRNRYLQRYLLSAVVGCVCAVPLGLYAVTRWLEEFSIKVSVSWWQWVPVFAVVCLMVAAVVVMQVRRAMTENPADVLKSE